MSRPITFLWTDEGMMRPLGVGMSKRADEEFVVGEFYRLVELEEPTIKTRGHYFASLKEMFDSLPEDTRRTEDWAESVEHMRKWALIKTGFRDVKDYPCETKAEAKRWAARKQVDDDYAIVLVEGTVVRVLKAKSQSLKAMPTKGEFQRSKEAVLDYLADMLKLPSDAEQRKP